MSKIERIEKFFQRHRSLAMFLYPYLLFGPFGFIGGLSGGPNFEGSILNAFLHAFFVPTAFNLFIGLAMLIVFIIDIIGMRPMPPDPWNPI